jgi:lactate dehydrogenase-like 2-hydroxyacid dehydrogenase
MHFHGDLIIIAITLLTTVGMVTLGPIGRAVAERLRGKGVPGAVAEIEERFDDLAQQINDVQRQVGEIVERQDFSERLLARAKDRGLLDAGNGR